MKKTKDEILAGIEKTYREIGDFQMRWKMDIAKSVLDNFEEFVFYPGDYFLDGGGI
jgi:hypothetical protein